MANLNVLLIGKSGVGKSSLVNYLMGAQLAKTGVGSPVTPKNVDGQIGIYPYDPIKLDDLGIHAVFHDTWGLEADKAEEWCELILKKTEDSELNDDVNDWMHSVVYCLSSQGARLEGYEIDKIINPLLKKGTSVILALTKSDTASSEEIDALKKLLRSKTYKPVEIIEISSETKVLRNGKSVSASGKEELLRAMGNNIEENLKQKLYGVCLLMVKRELEQFSSELIGSLDDIDSWYTTSSSFSRYVRKIIKPHIKYLNAKFEYWLLHNVNQSRYLFQAFQRELGINAQAFDKYDFIHQADKDRLKREADARSEAYKKILNGKLLPSLFSDPFLIVNSLVAAQIHGSRDGRIKVEDLEEYDIFKSCENIEDLKKAVRRYEDFFISKVHHVLKNL